MNRSSGHLNKGTSLPPIPDDYIGRLIPLHSAARHLNVQPEVVLGLARAGKIPGFRGITNKGNPLVLIDRDAVRALRHKIDWTT